MGQKDFSWSVKEANSQHVNNIDINTQKKWVANALQMQKEVNNVFVCS